MVFSIGSAFHSGKQGQSFQLTCHLTQPVTFVWAGLIDPKRLAEWIGVEWLGGAGPLREGDALWCRFHNTVIERRGRVLRLQPETLLEHTWTDDRPGDVVRWELTREDGGCRLSLTHTYAAPADAPRTAAGWSQVVERLAASFGDESAATDHSQANWRRWRDHYAKVFPPEASRDGRLAEVDGLPTLRFERSMKGSPALVWEVLVEPSRAARLLGAEAVVEPTSGGCLRLQFDPGSKVIEGRIVTWEPPSVLEVTFEPYDTKASTLRIELDGQDDRLRLVATHTAAIGANLPNLAARWHSGLDTLESTLIGKEGTVEESRLISLTQVYAAIL